MRIPVLFLVRHARTPLNAANVLRGRLDPELDAVGVAQAERLAKVLGPLHPGRVLSSPLKRAMATAAAIAAPAGVQVISEKGLLDRDYGQWAGHPAADVEAQWGSIDEAPGVEPVEAVTYRALVVLDQQVAYLGEDPIVLVSHDAVNRALLAALDPDIGAGNWIGQRTGCWNRLEHHEGQWRVVQVDQVPAAQSGTITERTDVASSGDSFS